MSAFERDAASLLYLPPGVKRRAPAPTQYEHAEPGELPNADAAAQRVGGQIRDKGRAWPDFAIGDKLMIKGVLFVLVGTAGGEGSRGLVVKPYTGRPLTADEKKQILADMIPKR